MHIAIIGTGNVGGALATAWARAGHHLHLGTRTPDTFADSPLLQNPNTALSTIGEAVRSAEVILLAVPAPAAAEVTTLLGDTTGKIIIDAMNIVMGRGPAGYTNTTDAILANTQTRDVVKCFNTTGFNNMIDPRYGDLALDLFMAGDSERGKRIAEQLAHDAGFAACYDVGGNDKFQLMEQFAFFWINLAMFQKQGREIGFKLLRR